MGEAGGINFSGLGSGLDTKSIVQALVSGAQAPIRQAEQKQALFRKHQNIFSEVKSLLESASTKAKELDSKKELLSYTASSSDEEKIQVAAGGDAYPGNYSIEITNLASAQRTYSTRSGLTSETDTLGFSTGDEFTITDGTGETKTITLSESSTLSSIAASINGSGAEVTAGILFDGTNYHLQISGNKTGSDNSFSIDETGISDPSVALNITSSQQTAQDASFTLDGFSISSSENTVNDTIPGLTLTLKEATTSPVTIQVDPNPDAITTKIEEFVAAYNSVMKRVNQELKFTGVANKERLQGDTTLRGLQTALFNTIGNPIDGVTGDYTTLASIGITTGENGELEIDKNDLQDALNTDIAGVSKLFIKDPDAETDGVAQLFQDTAKNYTDFVDGFLTTRIKGYDTSLNDLAKDIERIEKRVSAYEAQLNSQFLNLEITMVKLQAQNQQVFGMMSAIQ